jgi:putative transposase
MFRQRKKIRLRNFDYASESKHFITICTQNRDCTLGIRKNGQIILSPVGNMAYRFWKEIPDHFPHIILDEFIIMPNHVHGIIILDYSNIRTSKENNVGNNDAIGTGRGTGNVDNNYAIGTGRGKGNVDNNYAIGTGRGKNNVDNNYAIGQAVACPIACFPRAI